MTPKSLLRHKKCVSNISEFTKKSTFHRVLEDDAYNTINNLLSLKKRDEQIKKVVICSGKIYYDLLEAREKHKNDKVTFVRIEQLYPFPVKTLANVLKRYSKASLYGAKKNQKIWVLKYVRNYIDRTLEMVNYGDKSVKYVGRKAASLLRLEILTNILHNKKKY